MSEVAYLKYADSLMLNAAVQAKDPDDSLYADYSVVSGFPLANMLSVPVQRPAKISQPSESDPRVHVQFDLGSAQNFNVFILAGHNLSATAVVSLYGGATLYPGSLLATITWTDGGMFHKFSSTQNCRYLMLDIYDPYCAWDYYSLGLVMTGMLTLTSINISEDWNKAKRAVNIRNSGDWVTPISRNLFSRRRVTLPFVNAMEGDFEDLIDLYDDLRQDTASVFILPDPDDHYGFVGRIADEIKYSVPYSKNGTGAGDELIKSEMTFIEDAHPILL